MKTKLIFAAAAAVAVISGIMGYSSITESKAPTVLALANVEALTQDNEVYNFEKREENTLMIWDDTLEIYHSITFINCTGKGNIVCP